ncbi:metallophosphoesterase [Phytomonospora endophytica]|uniref:3',5'-cyclic AMP phosphodiesterase CpdA n=1 Tax=Phytomonospora endophytica TaxID=714109 RepID=A0A841FPD8_9ACTN|nr:metallophosphoesterase [Phytomonospora endophytica]MBB6035107.1 3',5'-cyclic AMP phosphodiesterase CpdA [Phytomonospora endophytica]GIG64145.1 3',5'-cyclic adenosine monophosphate phosphodiesterase CpdA [Phytomonospora endophytica]
MALIAHLSDPHVTTGPLAAAHLRAALGRVLALDRRPELVVITGDLAGEGLPEEYAKLAEVLDGFPLPLHLVAGNHDDSAALAAAFGLADTRYVVDHADVTLVVLDSRVPGKPGGLLGAGQLRWLDAVLTERPGKPAFVAVHHPPIAVGIPLLDGMRLDDGPGLAEVLARHPHVARVLSGHVHRPVVAPFAGTVLAVAPSTFRQTGLTLLADPPAGPVDEPAAFLLHAEVEGTWVTHTVPVG